MVFIREKNNFYGFVSAGGRRYTFELTFSEHSLKPEGLLKVDWRLKRDLGETVDTFLNGYSEFRDPEEFYHQFSSFVQNNLKTSRSNESWLQHPYKTTLLIQSLQQEIERVGDHIKNVDLKSGLVTIEITDCQFRIHKAVLKLGQNYKNEPLRVISHDLPQIRIGVECNPNLDSIFSVTDFCDKFLELVNFYQQFWNTMSVLDAQCCVLDPPNPTFKDVFRRIKLSDTLSVVLTLNPFCPSQRPKIKLLGCQTEVIYYENVIEKNIKNDIWDSEEDLLFNLSNILEISVPSKILSEESVTLDQEEGKCAICFMWRLNDEIPNEVCGNLNCKSVYHSTCLFTYFISIPRNRDYFGKIQGECPNCDYSLSCTVPKLL